MIISNLTGGLGNQMFQYALGRHLAIKNKTKLKLHFTNALFCTQRSYALDCFNIRAEMATDDDLKKLGIVKNRVINRMLYLIDERFGIRFNKNVITQRFPYKFDPSTLNLKDNVYIQGYWADERYFKQIEETIKGDFTFKGQLDVKNQKMADLITKTNSVSIHVRRTDYVNNSINNPQFIGLDYYINSIKEISKRVSDPVFFIFSDDINWCKQNIRSKYKTYYVDNNRSEDSYKDMWLMSLCKHNIIANSTFSWWGRWLNKNSGKIVIKP